MFFLVVSSSQVAVVLVVAAAARPTIMTTNNTASSCSTCTNDDNDNTTSVATVAALQIIVNDTTGTTLLQKTIPKLVIRSKLSKQRHLVLEGVICREYMDRLFCLIKQKFQPQTVLYNGGRANIPEWKISCYLEVMEGGIPTTHPHTELLEDCYPLLNICNTIFQTWYQQQHSKTPPIQKVKRLMTFITRYNSVKQGENALLKHVDGAGKVDGSVVVALPTDEPFEGGGLTFYYNSNEIHYDTKPGDITLIDRVVWHQADPITSGVRWALVIFYQVVVV